jgi:UDP-glucose 4-epimerase
MKVVVTGATGNVGTALVRELLRTPEVESVAAVSRRRPASWVEYRTEQVTWLGADVGSDDLVSKFRGADAVVHLAWLFQPTRRPDITWRANVVGSRRVMEAAAESGVTTLVVASSIGAYSPRRSLDPVDESYPTDGVQTAAYSREKAYVERMLDTFVVAHPSVRVVRMRPGFIFQHESATEQRRLFLGPLVPEQLVGRMKLPVIPDPGGPDGLRLQTLHSDDAARAYRLALTRPVEGAFNIAADPVLDVALLARTYHARRMRVPVPPVRLLVDAAWRARLVPAAPGLFDMLCQMPVMSIRRAHEELGWTAERSSLEALDVLFQGMRTGGSGETPPLAKRTSGPLRLREIGTGVGSRP